MRLPHLPKEDTGDIQDSYLPYRPHVALRELMRTGAMGKGSEGARGGRNGQRNAIIEPHDPPRNVANGTT